jgi:hypothetical protein
LRDAAENYKKPARLSRPGSAGHEQYGRQTRDARRIAVEIEKGN